MAQKLILYTFIFSVCVLAGSVWAVDVIVTASSDSTIDSRQPDTAFPSEEVLKPDMIGPYDEDGDIIKCYIQFHLPADVGEITAADLRVFRTGTANASLYTYVHALNDDTDQGITVDDYTWNNAPGNTPNYLNITWSQHLPYADQNTTTFLTGINAYTTNLEYGLYDADILTDFLQSDTDGTVTLLLCRRQNYVYDFSFASLENSEPLNNLPPRLSLSYIPTPVVVTRSGDTTEVIEGGAQDTYEISLGSAPVADVTVEISFDAIDISLSDTSVTFTPADYAPKTITITAVDDSIGEALETVLISHTVTSADPVFNGVPARAVSVSVIDNDAVMAVLNATADSTIKRTDATSAFPLGDLLPNRYEVDAAPTEMDHCYVQFDLPVDYVYAVGAQLSMVQTSVHPSDPNDPGYPASAVYIIGVNDEVPQGSADSFTWINAPGNDERSGALLGAAGYDADEAVEVGQFSSRNTETAGAVVTSDSGDLRLTDFLNTDSDGQITLLLIRDKTSDLADSFASSENATYDGPQLILTYAVTSYCGQPGQIYHPGDLDIDCNVGASDILLLAENWLNCTDPLCN